jgi:Ca-activated chloride channel family protein
MHVKVNLVTVVASVLDAAGKPVAELPRQAFRISQDGQPQKIAVFERETNLPLDLALMVDTSLSAYGELKFEREAAEHFLRQVLRPGDRAAIFTFAYDVDELSPFTGNLRQLDSALARMRPGTGTSLFDAVFLGSRALAAQPAGRRRVLLLVTDAGETTSRTSYDQARNAAVRSGAMLYVILIRAVRSVNGRNTAGEHALDTVIASTGGATLPVYSSDQFGPMFSRVGEELRTEYLLGYYPDPEPVPGSYHQIRVWLAHSGAPGAAKYRLEYRKEYFVLEAKP